MGRSSALTTTAIACGWRFFRIWVSDDRRPCLILSSNRKVRASDGSFSFYNFCGGGRRKATRTQFCCLMNPAFICIRLHSRN